jgi:hypothetical protein
MRRQEVAQCTEARRQHINRERVRLTELQYVIANKSSGKTHRQIRGNSTSTPTPTTSAKIQHSPATPTKLPHPLSLTTITVAQPIRPTSTTIRHHRPKRPLGNHLQLAPWPSYYQATPHKYYGNTDPHKFLMSHETAIASAGGDDATLAKSLIISLEDTAANWYSRLPAGCIYSWPQLKEKFFLNFQGFQTELDSEEDFLLCTQREKETLPNFYRRFLQMKAQAPEVLDDQVIAQAIKALHAEPLHNHLVRERPKTVSELYEQFAKFSKSEIQFFHKLEQQRKISKPDEAPRPHHNESQCNYPKPIDNIDSDGYGPLENWEKNYGTSSQQTNHSTTSNQRFNQYN